MENFGKILHGCDYNPDQWMHRPDILEEDIRLMKKAHVNCVTLGVFSWAALEPAEGEYEFGWLEERIQTLYENGIYTILATPTGALPMWLSAENEEVHQMLSDGTRRIQGFRHNFCPSSPLMRRKMREIDSRLSRAFGQHPGVIAWHISNEYGGNNTDGTCHCPLCQKNFRSWLKERYGTLDELNHAWWTGFWSHTYTDWSQIHSPCPLGDTQLHGLNLDWKRFHSAQMQDFLHSEIEAVRQFSDKPVTTNFMGAFKPYNYFKWARELDVVSIDSYPFWHFLESDVMAAMSASAFYDMMRSMKRKPFLLMESVTSTVNWMPNNPLKRPGMHALSSLQAIAGGSNSVQYFQWRKSRGGPEKFHGSVVDHKNGEDTRVFRDVTGIGQRLERLSERIIHTCNQPKAAIIFDWENWWAFDDAVAWYNPKDYRRAWMNYYQPFWNLGIDVDIVDMECELDGYVLVIAPLNYMYRGDYTRRVKEYVEQGGTYVTTCFSGEVDDTDLCFEEKHPLEEVMGIRIEEIDAPGDSILNTVQYEDRSYRVSGARALVHPAGAEVLAVYEEDFYAGCPALTRNQYGKGTVYFIASQNEDAFNRSLVEHLIKETHMESNFRAELPLGVTVRERKPISSKASAADGGKSVFFVQNFNRTKEVLDLERDYRDLETGEVYREKIELAGYQCLVLEKI